MRVSKSSRAKKAARVKKPTKSAKAARGGPATSVWSIAAVLMIVFTAAVLMAARRGARPADSINADARPAGIVTTDEEAMRQPAPAAPAVETPAEPSADVTSETAAPVTITGCLERDQETFRLKNTVGADAPKARSWKSGFLKKSAASIQIIDAANKVKLPSHVGERVQVRGTLVDREMHVRSLQRIAESCTKA
jgi:hypothetical protein